MYGWYSLYWCVVLGIGKKSLAASAVAGLASVENFAAVKLRKTNRNQEEMGSGSSAGVTFSAPSVSLIHIKGNECAMCSV